MFDSPKAFSLVVEALLERDDFVASMALLIHWLNQADHVPLERADSSFHQIAQKWLVKLLNAVKSGDEASLPQSPRSLVRKFFDYLEANAEEYWNAPRFRIGRLHRRQKNAIQRRWKQMKMTMKTRTHLYSAAYDNMVYSDSTDDGVEGELYETGDVTADELSFESQRISDRLAFLSSLARLWKLAAVGQRFAGEWGRR